jgi:hypothetical protein
MNEADLKTLHEALVVVAECADGMCSRTRVFYTRQVRDRLEALVARLEAQA